MKSQNRRTSSAPSRNRSSHASSSSSAANGNDSDGDGGYSGAPYCVLVLDEVTTPIVSGATSVSEVLDYGVARE